MLVCFALGAYAQRLSYSELRWSRPATSTVCIDGDNVTYRSVLEPTRDSQGRLIGPAPGDQDSIPTTFSYVRDLKRGVWRSIIQNTSSRYFEIVLDLDDAEWSISNETKTEQNVTLTKVSYQAHGIRYICWIDLNSPVAAGPGILQNPPGLIYSATRPGFSYTIKLIEYCPSECTDSDCTSDLFPVDSKFQKVMSLSDYERISEESVNDWATRFVTAVYQEDDNATDFSIGGVLEGPLFRKPIEFDSSF